MKKNRRRLRSIALLLVVSFFLSEVSAAAPVRDAPQRTPLEEPAPTPDPSPTPTPEPPVVLEPPAPLPVVEGAHVQGIDRVFTGEPIVLIQLEGVMPTDHITYDLDGEVYHEAPKREAVGRYSVTVRIEREGYEPLEEVVEARIRTRVEPYEAVFNSRWHDSAVLKGLLRDDIIEYRKAADVADSWTSRPPRIREIGEYAYEYRVYRAGQPIDAGRYTAKISPIPWDEGIEVIPYAGIYDGQAHPAVSIKKGGGWAKESSLDGGVTWQAGIPAIQAAGSYEVRIRFTRVHHATHTVTVTATIAKAQQSVAFVNRSFRNEAVQLEFYDEPLVTSFEAEGGLPDVPFIYSVVDATEEAADLTNRASIDANGRLTVLKEGVYQVRARKAGDANHEEAVVETRLFAQNAGNLLRFAKEEVVTRFGEHEGVLSTNVANKLKPDDYGDVRYEIQPENLEKGLALDETSGEVRIADYDVLAEALEQGSLVVEVTAQKAPGYFRNWRWLPFPTYQAASARYTLRIEALPVPKGAYEIADGKKGEKNWYVEPVRLESVDATKYELSMTPKPQDFGSSVTYPGSTVKEPIVYLRDVATGAITVGTPVKGVRIDLDAPQGQSIVYGPAVTEKEIDGITYHYYQEEATFSLSGKDAHSGVQAFVWTVEKERRNAHEAAESWSERVEVDPVQPEATVSVQWPAADVARNGRLSMVVYDEAGNASIVFSEDRHRLVVDKEAPKLDVAYENIVRTVDGHHYARQSAAITLTMTERNFFPKEAEVILVSGDGTRTPLTPTWEAVPAPEGTPSAPTDQYRARIALESEGDFFVEVKYTDPSGNALPAFRSEVVTLDTSAPQRTVRYTTPHRVVNGISYYQQSIEGVVQIRERNFFSEEVVAFVTSQGESTPLTIEWKQRAPDLYEGRFTLPNDGDFYVHVDYTDASGNAMEAYHSQRLTIDRVNPTVEVTYGGASVFRTMTDFDGTERAYFPSARTATLTITERNFNEEEVRVQLQVRNLAGELLPEEGRVQRSSWRHAGDTHTMDFTYSGEANYTFDVDYTDLAGNRAADYTPDRFTVDTTAPTDLQISYSPAVLDTTMGGLSYAFYQDLVTVHLSARDETAGVDGFTYSYRNDAGVSAVNAQLLDQAIGQAEISYSEDRRVARASFTVPRSTLGAGNQFRGTVDFRVVDRSSHEGERVGTTHLVVDNLAPIGRVDFNTPVQTVDGTTYYDGPITATITVEEANFDSTDVVLAVTREGATETATATWSSQGDTHIGRLILSEEGAYRLQVSYRDKSGNEMNRFTSPMMIVDTTLEAPTVTINGEPGDGRAYREDLSLAISMSDRNYASYEWSLLRTRYGAKDEDVTDQFLGAGLQQTAEGAQGVFETFEKTPENDGIYTLRVQVRDYAGHVEETNLRFTVNRFGSVYEYEDYLQSLIAEGGRYVQAVDEDLIIHEYNADRLVAESLNIVVTQDGRALDAVDFSVSPVINERVAPGASGWFEYEYRIARENFQGDGVYKIAISSRDATGNQPETGEGSERPIRFCVDQTKPEITSIVGLEEPIINAETVEVHYDLYDTMGLRSVTIEVDGVEVAEASHQFDVGQTYYAGVFRLSQKPQAQTVRLVVEDLAGNQIDTASADFTSAYVFEPTVTISTDWLVRWRANRTLFWGSLAGGGALLAALLFWLMSKRKKGDES